MKAMTRTVAEAAAPLELPELLELELLPELELLEPLELEPLELLELLELELLELEPPSSSLQPTSRPLAAQALKSVMTRCLNRMASPS
ncbi:MAG: hypothetical protein ACHQIO_01655 [Nevskiales bacterium]